MKEKKILVVGAGFAGATISRVLAENSYKVQIIDKRNHIAGNAFDYINNINERIHKYGPHLLHCNKSSIALRFLSRFTEWINYEHRVEALLKDGRTTPLPINRVTLEDFYHKKFSTEADVIEFLDVIRNKNIKPRNTDELFESSVGNELANTFFRPYTKKMWGVDPKFLDIAIGARLPVRFNNDSRYFNDSFQALPKQGYSKLIENMLSHENISIKLSSPYEKNMENDFDHSFLCIPIDEYFDFEFGQLPYRSIIFENRREFRTNDQSAPVINFTDNSIYTRKTQWNLFPNSSFDKNRYKTITYEIPCDISLNKGEYYYPVNTEYSKSLYLLYKKKAETIKNVSFCGRTGLYRYIDMIPAVLLHLEIAKKYLKKNI